MQQLERHHDLDSLRSTMLMLGLVVHASQAYFPKENGLQGSHPWYFHDSTGSLFVTTLVAAIHVYRMPLFFVLAGFFASLLVAKRGLRATMINRAARVAAPLVVSLVTIVPLIHFATDYAIAQRNDISPSESIQLGIYRILSDNLHHLWFLWHLMIFYLATWIAVGVGSRIQSNPAGLAVTKWMHRMVNSNWGTLGFVTISLLFLTPMKSSPGSLDTAFGFVPPWYVLGIYGLCYAYGWFLFQNRIRIKRLAARANTRMAIGVASVSAYLATLGWYLGSDKPESLQGILVVLSAISIWTLIEGWLALFQKYFHQPNRISRYVADSSYWVYLTHLPVIIFCQGALANTNLVAEIKFLIALLFGSTVCLASYHVLVRATLIGRFLNGRRHAIGMPVATVQRSRLREV